MSKGKINGLLVFFSGIGALVGFFVGELLLAKLGGRMPAPLLIGLYFGQLGMFIGIMCLLAEMIYPKLNGLNWKNQYLRSAWLYLIPATLLMISVGGALFQLIYQVDKKAGKPNDFMMVMDISGSMESTDQNNDRLSAVTEFIDNMDRDQRVGLLAFDHSDYMIQPMVYVDDQGVKEEVKEKVMALSEPMGGTEIEGALNTAMEHIKERKEKGRKAMVILLSDGYSEVHIKKTLAPYIKEGIIINTIGLVDPYDLSGEGIELLQQIADGSGGQFYNVEDSLDVTNVMKEIYTKDQVRWLVGDWKGPSANARVYKFLRILFLAGVGFLIGLSIGIIFDNRYLAKAYMIGGVFSGIASGIVLEVFSNRFFAVLSLGVLFTLFSMFVEMKRGAESFRRE